MTGDRIALDGTVLVAGGDRHRHAARRLREMWPQLDWQLADEAEIAQADRPVVRLTEDDTLAEGAFAIDVERGGAPRIIVSGGPFSGVIYGVEEMVGRRGAVSGKSVELAVDRFEAAPGLPYRTFWNWDHSTNWDLEQVGVQEIGVFNPYGKPPSGFLSDFRRAVDFMSRNRIAAVVIYGFLRDTHGGIEAAQELCRYAAERGVRILPGIAINAYGGVYWEGDHHFNLATRLRERPDLAASLERPVGFKLDDLAFPLNFPRSDYTVSGCPSHPENQQWMEDAVAWLAETFEIGGINIESGDYGVCGCPRCAARRAAREDAARRHGAAESWSHADMADFYPRLFAAANASGKNLWLYSELQWDNMLDREAHALLRDLPDAGIYQHTLNRSYWNRVQQELTAEDVAALPTRRNVFRAQFACQWNGSNATERYRFNARDFAELSWKAAATGVQGLTVWGEASPFDVPVELSYLAFGRFTYDPSLTWNQFLSEEIAPRLGGDAAAERYLHILDAIDREEPLPDATWVGFRHEALDAARVPDDGVSRRWVWLADRVARRQANIG
ncbi:MAG: hypothetical protein IT337_06170 [Thermomicrobiales bacterium]|nr:hypothetical protein [Thermomicrobiales bacterium]